MGNTPRTCWLTQSDDDLLGSCSVDTYRASGPGGQKRNKTSSAVRLRHLPSGISVIAEESRSQHENKARALRRLRHTIALQLREPPQDTQKLAALEPLAIDVSKRDPAYPLLIAKVLDVVYTREGRIKDAAGLLGLSTAQLSKFIVADPKAQAAVNELRRKSGLRPLRE